MAVILARTSVSLCGCLWLPIAKVGRTHSDNSCYFGGGTGAFVIDSTDLQPSRKKYSRTHPKTNRGLSVTLRDCSLKSKRSMMDILDIFVYLVFFIFHLLVLGDTIKYPLKCFANMLPG